MKVHTLNKTKNKIFLTILLFLFLALASTSVISSEEETGLRYPALIDVNPKNTAQEIDRTTSVRAIFSKDMDPSSINKDTFFLTQRRTPLSGEIIKKQLPGTIHYDVATRTATFTPNEIIQPDQHYGNVFTATITTGVKDLGGNNLQQEYLWSFTTGNNLYHTGPTTSQQTTQSTPVPQQNTPTNPPVTTSTNTNKQTSSSWFTPYTSLAYILSLLALAIIILLVLVRMGTPVKKTSKDINDNFGKIYPVSDVEGIGDQYTQELKKINIVNTKQLWDANTKEVAKSINTNAKTVENWQQMAELMAVKGIGPQYAELLERSGVKSVRDLAAADSHKLLKRVQKKEESLDVRIQGNTPGNIIVESWIKEANEHQMRGKEV